MRKRLFLFFSFGIGVFFYLTSLQFFGSQNISEKVRFVIKLNTSEYEIIKNLKTQGFINNELLFSLILTFKRWHGKIQPGAYFLPKKLNPFSLAQILISGPSQKWVVVPPGLRKEQVALILKKNLDWTNELLINFINLASEGYLYPDTYLIPSDADPRQVILIFKNNFNKKLNEELFQELLNKNIRYDTALKIASLIERESGSDEDKPIIAGIIWNRLEKGVKLEIDAAVQFAIATQKCELSNLNFGNWQKIENCDFWPFLEKGVVKTIKSKYNTYLYKGLPPGPICSPSLASLKAVVYPQKTEALYYLHSSDKRIHTAKTLEEHYENIKKYLKI